MKRLVLFLIISAAAVSVFAGGPGTTGVNYMRIGMGARAEGMGEAQVAIADNVDAIYWNPAGLAFVRKYEIGLMHLVYWQGISYESAGAVIPMKNVGVFAVGGTFINSGSIDKTVENNTGSNYTLNGTFNYSAYSAQVSYASKFILESQPVYLGATLKFVGDGIDGTSAMAVGADIGGIYVLAKNLLVGASIANIGTVLGEDAGMPLTMRIGAGYRIPGFSEGHAAILAVDGVLPIDAGIKANIGIEYGINRQIFLRTGYKFNYDLESLTFGAGYRMNSNGTQYEIDYAFAPGLEDIGGTHRISLIVRFGSPLSLPGEERD